MKPLQRQQRWKTNVDLKPFSNRLESEVTQQTETDNTIRDIMSFHETVIRVATETKPKTKPGKKTKSYLTPAVKSLIREKNSLRRNLKQHRTKWLEKCKEVREAIQREGKELD